MCRVGLPTLVLSLAHKFDKRVAMNISKYFEAFFNYLVKIRGYSPQTLKTYKIALELLQENHELEGKTLNIMALRIKLQNHSKRSISTKLSAIRSFVKYLKNHHSIELKIKGDQSVKVPKTLPKPIDNSKIVQAIEQGDIEIRLIIKMLYGLGLRISELANLELKDISNSWIRVTGKGDKTREIPIVDSLSSELNSYLASHQREVYLFEKKGKPLSDAQLRYKINREFAKIGIKATPHQLRHAFATDLLANGARIADVSELLGHSSMATTQIYTKLTNATKLENYMKAHPLNN